MDTPITHNFFSKIETNREYQFWGLQLLGWGGLCVITFLSLTVWYGTPNWRHVSHTLIQAALGVGLTIPLRYIYRRIWNRRLLLQFVTLVLLITVVSAIWTALRMQTFLWLGEEYDIWKDFGGWYFGSFMVFLSWSALYFGVKFYLLLQQEQNERMLATQRVQEEQLKRLSAETGSREAQIKMLRYQLNPHFLFNTLNSISALIKTKRPDQARQMVSQLGDFLRFSLDNDASQMVTVSEEIEAINLYLDIEKVRYGERLKLIYDIDSAANQALIPSLLLQPLLENALKYAVAGRVDGGTIKISTRANDNRLCVMIDDNGAGLPNEMNYEDSHEILKRGVGLRNIYERLQSHYSESAELKFFKSDLGGLKVKIVMPLKFGSVSEDYNVVEIVS